MAAENLFDFRGKPLVAADLPVSMCEVLEERRPFGLPRQFIQLKQVAFVLDPPHHVDQCRGEFANRPFDVCIELLAPSIVVGRQRDDAKVTLIDTAGPPRDVPKVLGRHLLAIGILVAGEHQARHGKVDALGYGRGRHQNIQFAAFRQPLHDSPCVVGKPGMMHGNTVLQQRRQGEVRSHFVAEETLDVIQILTPLGQCGFLPP